MQTTPYILSAGVLISVVDFNNPLPKIATLNMIFGVMYYLKLRNGTFCTFHILSTDVELVVRTL